MGKGEWGGGQDADQGVQTCALGSAHHTPLVQDGIGIPPPPPSGMHTGSARAVSFSHINS